MRFPILRWLVSLSFLLALVSGTVSAAPVMTVSVKTILATQDQPHLDSRLGDLIKELQSVFRYTAYRLLSSDQLRLGLNQTGSVPLPGKRTLKITPLRVKGNRAELRLEINKGRQNIFNTVVQLLNRASLTIGGPKHANGVLLFNISNSF
jgi:hypothetical protein